MDAMNAPLQIDAGFEPKARDRAMGEAVALLTNLLRCILWLIKNGVTVTGFSGRRSEGYDRLAVTVAADPRLHKLFNGDCTWWQRRQEGALTIYSWVAVRYEGIRIEWEETCA